MKITKLILLCGILAFFVVSCSNSESSIQKPKPVHWTSLAPAGHNTTVAPRDTLFSIIQNPALTKEQKKLLTGILQGHKARISYHFARLNPNIEMMLNKEDTLAIPISSDTVYTVVSNHLSSKSGFTYWKGFVPNTTGKIALTCSKKVITGGIGFPAPGKKFSTGFLILTLNDGLAVIIRVKRNNAIRLYG